MKLVDTSAWVEQLRRGGAAQVRTRVEELLAAGEAAWCPIIRLELWNGARGEAERRVLREMETSLPALTIDTAVWDQAVGLAAAARDRGVTVPASDLVVAACARRHQLGLEHNDSHFDLIATL